MRRTMDTGSLRLDPSALSELAAGFGGELVRPGDPSYDRDRRVWNGSIDRHPALIARCRGVADVTAALRFARRTAVAVAIRGGGHSFPGHSTCDDGLVIDLSPMRGIHVDPERRVARVQAGVLLGELDRETQQFGLAVPAGIVTHTGIAGLTLGGGIGWLQRRYGLTIDQLLSMDILTADGEFVRASPDRNPELFWGLRGGGGNFGIATSFEFRLNPVGPEVLAGAVLWPMEDAPSVLRFYREWITDIPDELTTIVVQRRAPALPVVPTELHGRHVVIVACCFAGDLEEGNRVLKPMRSFGRPLLDLCAPKPFVAHQAMFDPSFPHGRSYYFRACNVARLSDDVIDSTAEQALRITSPHSVFGCFHLGGAIRALGDDDTAFSGRASGHTFNFNATTETMAGFAEEQQVARDAWTALKPHQTGVYGNFLMEEGADRIRQAYGDYKYARLQALKAEYDPGNMFRLNQNIPPR